METRKPNGYWQSIDNVIAEAMKIIQEQGLKTLPDQKRLCELGYSSLSMAATKYHGGLRKLREILGENQKKRENGTLKNIDNVLIEIEKIKKKYGFKTIPSSGKLRELGYSSLAAAIVIYHGGFYKLRDYLDEEQRQKERGLWQSLDYTTEQVRKVMQEHGLKTLPSSKQLCELGYSSLSTAISKYHGGFHHFRKHMGGVLLRRDGVWHSLEYVLEQARRVMQENGFETLPPKNKLSELGYSSLSNAITKYHGGFHHFRDLLGEEHNIHEMGVWKDLDYTLNQARQFIQEHGLETLPSANKLVELGYSALGNAISKYHGGFRRFREHLGESQLRIKCGKWKDLDYTTEQAKKLMEEQHFETLPPLTRLSELGYSSLAVAIIKYHGGFHKFRTLLGEQQKKKEDGTWQDLEYTIEQAKKVMKEHGFEKLPCQNRLFKLGYSSLVGSISRYHGGFPHFRQILNQRLGIPSEKQQLENLLNGYMGENEK